MMESEPHLIASELYDKCLSGHARRLSLCLVKSLVLEHPPVNPLHSCDSEISLLVSSCWQPCLSILLQRSQSNRRRSTSLGFHWLIAFDEVTKSGDCFLPSQLKIGTKSYLMDFLLLFVSTAPEWSGSVIWPLTSIERRKSHFRGKTSCKAEWLLFVGYKLLSVGKRKNCYWRCCQ